MPKKIYRILITAGRNHKVVKKGQKYIRHVRTEAKYKELLSKGGVAVNEKGEKIKGAALRKLEKAVVKMPKQKRPKQTKEIKRRTDKAKEKAKVELDQKYQEMKKLADKTYKLFKKEKVKLDKLKKKAGANPTKAQKIKMGAMEHRMKRILLTQGRHEAAAKNVKDAAEQTRTLIGGVDKKLF